MKWHLRTYGFVGLDATLVPGPKRPFNFIGALDNDQYETFRDLVAQTKEETDHLFVFGHYPTRYKLMTSFLCWPLVTLSTVKANKKIQRYFLLPWYWLTQQLMLHYRVPKRKWGKNEKNTKMPHNSLNSHFRKKFRKKELGPWHVYRLPL